MQRSHHQSGFTLVELLLASTILAIGILGSLGTVLTVNQLCEANRESTLAYQAARRQMEQLQAEPFNGVLQRYNDDPNDDPDGVGTAPGPDFAVANLDLRDGDADGLAGRVFLPLAVDGSLRESLVDPALGMPRDLDGDGVVDAADHTDDHVLLPVRVRVEWTGKSGDRFVEFASMLSLRR